MRTLLAIVTALTLLASQVGAWSPVLPAKPCCANCGGQCCVKDAPAPLGAEPLAPAPVQVAPSVELLFVTVSPWTEIPRLGLVDPRSVLPSLPRDSARLLLERSRVLLI